MKLLFDSSVWTDHLRAGALDGVILKLRGPFVLWLDSVVATELIAGCRGKNERRTIECLLAPFERSGRVAAPLQSDFARGAEALSKLRAQGKSSRVQGARCSTRSSSRPPHARDFVPLARQMHVAFRPFLVFVDEPESSPPI